MKKDGIQTRNRKVCLNGLKKMKPEKAETMINHSLAAMTQQNNISMMQNSEAIRHFGYHSQTQETAPQYPYFQHQINFQ